jgi:hypothetical protein
MDSWSAFRLPGVVDTLHTASRPQGSGAGAQNMVGTLNGRIPKCHDAVADELVNGSTLLRDRAGDFFEIVRDLQQQVIWRETFGMARKILQIGKKYGEESRLNAQGQRNAGLDKLPDHIERNKGRERFQ